MPLGSGEIRRARTPQTSVRQLSSPGKRPMTLVRRLTSPSERSSRLVLRQRRRCLGRVAQVHHQGVEVVGQAAGGRAEAALAEVVDENLESLLGVAWVDRVVERLPVGLASPLALGFGELGQQVAHAVHGAVLAVAGRPAVLDGLDQPRGAVGDDEHRRAQAAGDEIATERLPVLIVAFETLPRPASSQSDSTSRIDSPRTNAPITNAFNGSVRSSLVARGKSLETNGAAASRTCGISTESSPSAVCSVRARNPLRMPVSDSGWRS